MDFSKALAYPFDDEDWLKKLGILLLVMFVPILNGMAVSGWTFETAQKVKANDPRPLAGWDDFGGTIMRGLMIWLAQLIYMIPALIFVCGGYAVSAIALMGAAGSNGDSSDALAGVATIIPLCCYCLAALLMIASLAVYAGGLLRYMERPEFSTFMQFGENFAFVQKNIGDFLMAMLFIAGAVLLPGIVIGWTGCGLLVVAVFQAYFSAHILGQLAAKLQGSAAPAM